MQLVQPDSKRRASAPSILPRLRAASRWQTLLWGMALFLALYVLVNLLGFRFVVQGSSMEPSLRAGDFLLVSRAHLLFGEPQRGAILIFRTNAQGNDLLIKRLVGLPGETLEFRSGQVYINGRRLAEPYLLEACSQQQCANSLWQLGADEYFLLGDNRNNSRDSRRYGPIARQNLIGLALLRYWPVDEFSWIHRIGFPEWNH